MAFDRSGQCVSSIGRACLELLESDPFGKNIADVLRLDVAARGDFLAIYSRAFEDPLSFDDFVSLAPGKMRHSRGKAVRLAYKLDDDVPGVTRLLYVVVTDATELANAEALVEAMKSEKDFLDSVLGARQFFGAFMRHVVDFSQSLIGFEGTFDTKEVLREAHTLKGGAGLFKAMPLMKALHALEIDLKNYCKNSPWTVADSRLFREKALAIRSEIDAIVAMFMKRFSMDALQMEQESEINQKAVVEFADYLLQCGHYELWQEYTRRVRSQSLFAYLRHFDMHIQDLADRFNKSVLPLQISGHDVVLPLRPYRALLESFVHIFRNIMDHGIEMPRERAVIGKPEQGKVSIDIHKLDNDGGGALRFTIQDDGCGINCDALRVKLMAKYPREGWQDRPEQDVVDSVLTHHLSSRDIVTAYSGQGVGMGAVKHEVTKLGGTVSLRSVRGKGTTLTVEVPVVHDLLEWDDSLSICADMDNDHKRLFELFNSLSLALSNGGGSEVIVPTMKELLNYACDHFSREEDLMRRAGYPDLASHIKQHEIFSKKVTAVYDDYEKSLSNTVAVEALEFVRNWLVNHIQKVDRAYSSYVQKLPQDAAQHP